MAVGVLIALSLVVVLAGFTILQPVPGAGDPDRGEPAFDYGRESSETISIPIMEQQLDEIDLFYSQRGNPGRTGQSPMGSMLWTSYFLKKNADVYNWITVTEPDGTRFKYESGKEAVQESSD